MESFKAFKGVNHELKGTKGSFNNTESIEYRVGYTYIKGRLGPKEYEEISPGQELTKEQIDFINTKGIPTVCSPFGFHYGKTLVDVFFYYPYKTQNPSNRFLEIEVLGPSHTDEKGDKQAGKAIKILRELTGKELETVIESHKRGKIEKNLGLEVVDFLQEVCSFPIVIGGSLSLYLQGARLSRTENQPSTDIDLIIPYYYNFRELEGKNDFRVYQECKSSSGNDFDYSLSFHMKTESGNSISKKLDVRIDNKVKYDIVTHPESKKQYRVCSYLDILEAKVRYALQGNGKHISDIEELIGIYESF